MVKSCDYVTTVPIGDQETANQYRSNHQDTVTHFYDSLGCNQSPRNVLYSSPNSPIKEFSNICKAFLFLRSLHPEGLTQIPNI
jgi:hypothetical protein